MTASARLRVLSDAHDGAQVFELLQPVINDPAGRVTRIEPRLAQSEAVAALRNALLAGEVYLSDLVSPSRPLSRDDSLAAIEEQRTWEPLPDHPVLLLNLTPEGEDALDAALRGHS